MTTAAPMTIAPTGRRRATRGLYSDLLRHDSAMSHPRLTVIARRDVHDAARGQTLWYYANI